MKPEFKIISDLINKNSHLKLYNINNNPTRNGILIALKKMGAIINLTNKRLIWILNMLKVGYLELFALYMEFIEL